MKRAALHNLGCKVNEYETEAMQELLEEDGYTIVPFGEEADLYLINTCSVTNIADRKSRQMIHRARSLNPDAIVVAAGCYVQTGADELMKDRTVDIIIGNNKKNDLIPEVHKLIEAREEQKNLKQSGSEADDFALEQLSDIVDVNRVELEFENLKRKKTGEKSRAFLKVQDGCNQFCSYCIIPYARGRVRSKSMEEVAAEVKDLVTAGYKEFVITGIHLDSYGQGTEYGLIDLVEKISSIQGVERIRFGSVEPRIITKEFVDRLVKIPQICPHFHLSLQSGCDRTLKRMNRKYTAAEYREGVRLLREAFDDPAITTDVIVGFPGETEEDFEECSIFLEEIGFYEMHVFKYSRRKGTPADRMPQQHTDKTKTARSHVLLEMSKRQSEEFRLRRRGKTDTILVEEREVINGREVWVGFTREYVRMAVDSDLDLKNQLVTGEVSGMLNEEVMLLRV